MAYKTPILLFTLEDIDDPEYVLRSPTFMRTERLDYPQDAYGKISELMSSSGENLDRYKYLMEPRENTDLISYDRVTMSESQNDIASFDDSDLERGVIETVTFKPGRPVADYLLPFLTTKGNLQESQKEVLFDYYSDLLGGKIVALLNMETHIWDLWAE